MSTVKRSQRKRTCLLNRLRDRIAASLGIERDRRSEIYIELARSASIFDVSYWMLVFFSAGIASLGLVLNSPAVIIGAMLISPMMGPILASGLSLAAGDFVLGVRAFLKLALSCAIAIGFAMILVAALPFKEVTAEIAARTRPNTLDLVIALLSGAIGSISICRDVKGVATSIPGVAIAVALMPPLCVAGYGLGVAFSLNLVTGLDIAAGGGLLFVTNLVAITFTAMVVFLVLHLDTAEVKVRVAEWRQEDRESRWLQEQIERLPIAGNVRKIGSLPGRFLSISVLIIIISIPLTQSFSQLRAEIARKQRENTIQEVARSLWTELLSKMPDGSPRSSIDQLTTVEQDGRLTLNLSVFTNRPLDPAERDQFAKLVASRLDRPLDSVSLQLVEVPTATSELLRRPIAEPKEEAPSVGELQSRLLQTVDSSLRALTLPEPAQLLKYDVTTSAEVGLKIRLYYISEREISEDARELITANVRTLLSDKDVEVVLERVPSLVGPLTYARNQAELEPEQTLLLDLAARGLQSHQRLHLTIEAVAVENERDGIAEERSQNIVEYLMSRWNVSPTRMMLVIRDGDARIVTLRLYTPADDAAESAETAAAL